jgi:predicted ATPase
MKNFKSWKDSGEVELAPLTGFFGTNSSGKSSLLQMLLLLKQTADRADTREFIFFGDKNSLVNLGNFYEVIHNHKLDAALNLRVKWKTPRLSTISSLTFDTTLIGNNGATCLKHFSYVPSFVASKNKVPVIRKIEGDDERLFVNGDYVITKYQKTCYGLLPQESLWEITDSPETPDWYRDYLEEFPAAFEELFSHVYYLGPTRVHPQRLYHWAGTHPKEIDLWGNKAIDALLSAGVRKLKSSSKKTGMLIEGRISEWLQKMKLAHSFQLIPTGSLENKNYEVRIQKSLNSAEVTLADLGYGVADIFPLLVLCYYAEEGSTLILQQPGIHLHPKAQADLADLLIEVITERNLQILIESHSEHLLTRLQRRIAEEKITSDQTALYFCRNDEGVSTIERLEIDELGNIKNWPENFFGEVMSDMFAMTDAQRKRMTNQDTED